MSNSPLFVNYGGAMQLRLKDAEDLKAIITLDEPFWMAVSAPTHQLHLDKCLLNRLDINQNGRILSHELKSALTFLFDALSDHEGINGEKTTLPLQAFNTAHQSGKHLHEWAQGILKALGKSGETSLLLADIKTRRSALESQKLNGDGVIPIDAIEDPKAKALAKDILTFVGQVQDLSGQMGVDEALLDQFLADATTLLNWTEKAEKGSLKLFPMGDKTAPAYRCYVDLKPALIDYFDLCRLAKVGAIPEGPSAGRLLSPEEALDPSIRNTLVAALPLAAPREDGLLDLGGVVSPFCEDKLQELKTCVLEPILGAQFQGILGESALGEIDAVFQLFREWQEDGEDHTLDSLGPERLKIHMENGAVETLRLQIEKDLAARPELLGLADLEYLASLQGAALSLCRNFVSFSDLYDPKKRATFELGDLVIDGRVLKFNMKVHDVKSHANAAKRSGIFLIYSEVTGKDSREQFFMVTPVTAGRRGQLTPNKRGVLLDIEGKEWDARVIQIVNNPVSLLEAFIMPFSAIAVRIGKAPEMFTNTAQKQVDSAIDGQIQQLGKGIETGLSQSLPPPTAVATKAPPQPPKGGLRDAVLSGGVAVAALGSSLAFITKTLAELQWDKVFAALAIAAVTIALPLTLMAAWRLRRRNLAAVLEASGWALNAKMYLTFRLGRAMTLRPTRPKHFAANHKDLLPTLRQLKTKSAQRSSPKQ